MSSTADILTAVALGEDDDWEFKSAAGGFPGNFWDTYSAMANSEGGTIVLGISDHRGVHVVDGLTAAQLKAFKKTLWDGVNNKGIVSANLLDASDVEERAVAGKALLTIRIPRAPRTLRPVHRGLNPLGGTYKRNHEGDYHCTEDEVRRMIADSSPEGNDQRILTGFTLADLDRASIDQYRQRMKTAKPDHPWLSLSDTELLTQLGGWRIERATGAAGLTLAGLLMFGKDVAIRDADAAPAYFVDYREKLDPDPATRWSDRISPDGTWEANLFQFYSRVLPKLYSALPTPFTIEAGVRRDFTPAHESLREAFVNAMIHAEYTVGGGIVVERYPDRIMLANPGTLLVSFEQYRKGGVSECRNRALQRMFSMIGGGEQAGSGAEKIRFGWNANKWRTPWIRVSSGPERVTLGLPMVSFVPDVTMQELRTRFGTQLDGLSKDELQALATAQLEAWVSNGRLRSLTTLHTADVSALFKRLCDQGMLVADGYGRGTTYSLPPRAAGSGGGNSSPLGANSSPLVANSSPLGANSSPLVANSSPLGADSSSLDAPAAALPGPNPAAQPLLFDAAPQRLPPSAVPPPNAHDEADVRRIAAPLAAKRKWASGEGEKGIVEMCRGRFLTGDQIATYLDRNPDSLRNRTLTPMVQAGLLRLRHPDAPNSPNQAYTTDDGH